MANSIEQGVRVIRRCSPILLSPTGAPDFFGQNMRAVTETLDELAERAATNGAVVTFVSGKLRIDVEHVGGKLVFSWRINGRTAKRADVEIALERARAGKPLITV